MLNLSHYILKLSFITFLSTNRYQKYSTSTKTNVQRTSEKNVPFVDFVVCPSYEMAYKKNVMKYYGLDIQKYRRGKSFYPVNHGKDIDPRKLFNATTYNVSELFSQIVVRTLNKDEPKIKIDFSSQNFSDRVIMTTKYYDELGRCYSVHFSDEVIQFGIISVAIQTKVDIYVYFVYPGQFMHVNSKSKV